MAEITTKTLISRRPMGTMTEVTYRVTGLTFNSTDEYISTGFGSIDAPIGLVLIGDSANRVNCLPNGRDMTDAIGDFPGDVAIKIQSGGSEVFITLMGETFDG